MRTHLEFSSTSFPIVKGEEEETNEGIFGKSLALFIAKELQQNGYATSVAAEDWGWMVELTPNQESLKFSPWVGCSNLDKDQWLVQIHPSTPYVRKFFNKIDVQPTIAQIANLFEQALVKGAAVTNLRWWSDTESGRKG